MGEQKKPKKEIIQCVGQFLNHHQFRQFCLWLPSDEFNWSKKSYEPVSLKWIWLTKTMVTGWPTSWIFLSQLSMKCCQFLKLIWRNFQSWSNGSKPIFVDYYFGSYCFWSTVEQKLSLNRINFFFWLLLNPFFVDAAAVNIVQIPFFDVQIIICARMIDKTSTNATEF